MEDNLAFRRVVGLLTDEDRFRILAAVSLGANTLEKIAAMTGLDNPKILKAIVKLEAAGLILKKEDSGYSFCIETLRELNRDLGHNTIKKAKESGLDRFFREGQLLTFPRSPDDKFLVLNHIACLFEYNHQYAEKEVNAKLKAVNPDFAALRRYLIDNEFLKRDHITDKDSRTITIYQRIIHQ